MSIDNPVVVDFCSINQAGECVLTISDHLPWDEKTEHLLILQEKLNRYLAFIESGEIYESFPHSKDRSFRISVILLFHPSPIGQQFRERAGQVIESAGFKFHFEQRDMKEFSD